MIYVGVEGHLPLIPLLYHQMVSVVDIQEGDVAPANSSKTVK